MSTATHILPTGGRSVDPQHLESLGKQAARMAEMGDLSLNDAVVQTIGHEKLNSEQVRRVVEFANVEAFNRKFAALEGPMRAVDIAGGPADPVHVIQALNNGARPREVSIEAMEFSMPPSFGKLASIDVAHPPTDRTPKGVLMEITALQSKLSAAHEEVVASAEASQFVLNETLVELADRAKRASLQGATADEIYAAWYRIEPELAKVAFARVRDLLPSGAKTAGVRRLNPDHEVVSVFADFVKAAQAYGGYVAARQSIERELAKVGRWLEER